MLPAVVFPCFLPSIVLHKFSHSLSPTGALPSALHPWRPPPTAPPSTAIKPTSFSNRDVSEGSLSLASVTAGACRAQFFASTLHGLRRREKKKEPLRYTGRSPAWVLAMAAFLALALALTAVAAGATDLETQSASRIQRTQADEEAAGTRARGAAARASFPPQGSYYETHMQEQLLVTDHSELHRRIREVGRQVQAQAEAVAASGEGKSEYLPWRMAREEELKHVLKIEDMKERGRRLEVLTGTSGSSSITPPALNSPPGDADINMTFFRHASVQYPLYVDWRTSSTTNTPVFDQKQCESCWLWAASDIISMKWALLMRFSAPVPLSPQHVCDCGYAGACCKGGWPEWTFSFARLNKGVATLDNYPYFAKSGYKCNATLVNSGPLTGKITGWEKLPASQPLYLMKTLAQHPAVVLIQSTTSFLAYKGGIWTGSDCPKRPTVNHALVALGFNVTGSDTQQWYWIAKNSWGTGWGEGGYIRIAMFPSMLCGFGREPSLYPTMFKVFTPCDAVPPPCGNGTCYIEPDSMNARCTCPAGYTEKLEREAPKCLLRTPCAASVNPCAFGTCRDKFDGSYSCWCPPGTAVGSRADGAETCIVNNFQSGLLTTSTVPGDNCTSLTVTYGITTAQLLAMNPFLNCSTSIVPGTLVIVDGPLSGVGCGATDVVIPGDSCAALASRNNITVTQLKLLNPQMDCSQLLLSSHWCVLPGQMALASSWERSCGKSYDTDIGDTCISVSSDQNVTLPLLEWLNPSVSCDRPLNFTSLCVAPLLLGLTAVRCTQYYNVTQADTCFTVAAASGLDVETFLELNPGVRCLWPHWVVGLSVCIGGVVLDYEDVTIPPNFIPYYVKINDTLAIVANRYVGKCQDTDGTLLTSSELQTAICWANGWLPDDCSDRRVAAGAMVLVPCAQTIGQTVSCAQVAVYSTWLRNGSLSSYTGNFYCGGNQITYVDWSCASLAMVTPGTLGGCTPCSSYCGGRAGTTLSNSYGTDVPGCTSNSYCNYPSPALASTASQWCTSTTKAPAVCFYARHLCSVATRYLGVIAVGQLACVNFQNCLKTVLGSTFSSCPFVPTLNCANVQYYDMSLCGI